MIEVRKVANKREKEIFLTFPWKMYRGDPLWVPPILSERRKETDPSQGIFFKNGYADFFIAWENNKPVGTICCSHEVGGEAGECSLGFFECVHDYAVAEAMFHKSEDWAHDHGLTMLCGTYNLDRENGRGILIEGWDRPPVILCGHNASYYGEFFQRFGFEKRHDDGLAYACNLNPNDARIQRLHRLADRVRERKRFTVRKVDMSDIEGEIGRIHILQNRALEHLPGFVPYTREAIEGMLLPLKDMADPELILFAEDGGKAIGWFPAIQNFNEILIHLNGLRNPWDYLRALRYKNLKPKCLSIKSVAVLPEYWDTGAAILLFSEMTKRAIARGYQWADLSLTGEDNPDTWDLAHHMGAKIYKRYRFYKKVLGNLA
ncbi:MAG TPA: GNAT family N-acetyltransferase [Anaerolineales bacterium]|nr:GNAT family N-acetyltransferase [Anaerolineales bacterium]HNN12899.1 GNAT family N-acetyltransferase [Anaerolineales bacterium]